MHNYRVYTHGLKLAQQPKPEQDDFYTRMSSEIVVLAVDDWRELIRKKAWRDENPSPRRNFDELRQFFKSGWCSFLMQDFDITPEDVLQLLEKELADAMRKE